MSRRRRVCAPHRFRPARRACPPEAAELRHPRPTEQPCGAGSPFIPSEGEGNPAASAGPFRTGKSQAGDTLLPYALPGTTGRPVGRAYRLPTSGGMRAGAFCLAGAQGSCPTRNGRRAYPPPAEHARPTEQPCGAGSPFIPSEGEGNPAASTSAESVTADLPRERPAGVGTPALHRQETRSCPTRCLAPPAVL